MAARQSRLVGREEQWRALTDGLAAARGGRGHAVFVFGAAGLGTTRLAQELGAAAASAGFAHVRGRSGAAGPVLPYRPIAEALLGLVRAEPDLDVSALGSYPAVLGGLVPQWWAGADAPQPSPVLIGEGVLQVCALVGAGRGLALVLEDLDDADAETLATAEYLVDQVSATPVLLVLTARDEHGPVGAIARAARQRGRATVCTLRPLAGDEIAELAAGFLDTTPSRLPSRVLDTLRAVADGSPLVIEELLQHLLDAGGLRREDGDWVLAEPDSLARSLAQSIGDRLDQLDPAVRAVLETAAVLGVRFPLSLVQAVHDLPDRELLAALAGGRRLVLPDDRDVDWYRFRHPSFREVILARVTGASRRRRAAEAARLLEALVPDPREDWLQLSIDLLERAGEPARAARRLTEVGRSELARGAAGPAVAMLDRAQQLLASADDGSRIDVIDSLLEALAETGQVDRAFALGEVVDAWSIGPLAHRRAELHVHLAWIAHVSGRWADGSGQIGRARTALAEATGEAIDAATLRRIGAGIDAAAAYLSFDAPDLTAGLATAVELAERTAALADAHLTEPGMSTLSCQAWHLLGMAAREVDATRSAECFSRVCEVADRHRLQLWRLYGLGALAANAWLGEASVERLERARDEAAQVGATVLSLSSRAILALAAAMFGEWDTAAAQARAVSDEARTLRLHGTARYALMVQAVAAGQRGDRVTMDAAMDEMAEWSTQNAQELALAIGLGRVFCALLEEDAAQALAELDRLDQLRTQVRSTFFLSGHAGLALLIRALHDEVELAELDELLATPAGVMRWNRQFLLWASAVVHGARGSSEAAERDRAAASEAGAVFPVARHLAQRLVGERALADGWGEPAAWLRASEAFFQERGVPAVASACRALLRRSGASVQQRRTGIERVPERMRQRGITVREYEVLELLRERLPNRAIAQRLSISARTVEKHVASAMAKLAVADRARIAERRWWDEQTGGLDAFAG